jgi:AraC-like DNA-binding protein
MGATLSTHHVPERDRLEYWNQYVCSAFVNCEVDRLDDDKPFNGIIHFEALEQMTLADIKATRSLVRRSRKAISTITEAYVKILYQVSGTSTLVQDNRTAQTQPGEWMIGDCTRPYDLWINSDDCHHLLIYIPQHVLFTRLPNLHHLTATAFSNRSGLGKVTYDFASSIIGQVPCLNPDVVPQLTSTFLDLFVTDVRETLEGVEASHRNGAVTAVAIKGFIHEHLSDPDLSIDMIAGAMHLSRSTIHLLFRMEDTTISRYIWDLRLEMSRNQLTDPNYRDRSLSEIAYDWGFGSLSHFSHSFKRRFGCSPRDYRKLS